MFRYPMTVRQCLGPAMPYEWLVREQIRARLVLLLRQGIVCWPSTINFWPGTN
jgi:hypothetical protein